MTQKKSKKPLKFVWKCKRCGCLFEKKDAHGCLSNEDTWERLPKKKNVSSGNQ